MGQHHMPVSVEACEGFTPHLLGCGLKTGEQLYTSPGSAQALELASPVDDYEEAAMQEGWTFVATEADRCLVFRHTDGRNRNTTWGELCDEQGIEPYQWEIYEHWAVSDWLADKLLARGEKVDKDCASLCVWGRPTTGQAIAIRRIVEDARK